MAIALVFDLDGVLFDSHPIHRKAWRELLQTLGREVSEEELDFTMDGAKREEILQHFLGPLAPAEIAVYSERKDAILRNLEGNVRTTEGLEVFLSLVEAASIPKAVVTSASRARTRRMLDRYALTDRFAVVVTGDDVPNGKTNPAIFLKSAEELGAAPRDVVVFEDAVTAVKVAKEIGMKCVGVAAGARSSQLLEAGAELVVADFRRLHLSDVIGLFRQPSPHFRCAVPSSS